MLSIAEVLLGFPRTRMTSDLFIPTLSLFRRCAVAQPGIAGKRKLATAITRSQRSALSNEPRKRLTLMADSEHEAARLARASYSHRKAG